MPSTLQLDRVVGKLRQKSLSVDSRAEALSTGCCALLLALQTTCQLDVQELEEIEARVQKSIADAHPVTSEDWAMSL
eukprot:4509106-Amphidinium_carterae.2